VELTPTQVAEIRSLLSLFYSRYIGELREIPFRDHSESFPSDGHGPEEAGRTGVTRQKPFWVAAAILELLGLALLVFEILQLRSFWSLPREFDALTHLFSSSVYLSIAITALIVVVIPSFLLFFKTPIHETDLLFARLLRAKANSESPIPRALIADLLADRRFRDIFDRAVELTFPPPQKAVLDRLVDALKEDPVFVQLYGERGGGPAPGKVEDLEPAIKNYFGYTARKLLFENILSDPNLLYLYDEMVHRRKWIAKWLSKIQWEKVKDVLGKSEEKSASKGADALGLANVILLLFVLIAIFGKFLGGGSSGSSRDAACQDEACAKVVAELPKVIQAAMKVGQQPGFGPQSATVPIFHVDVRPSSITLPPVEVKGPVITVPPAKPETTSKVEVSISPIEAKITPTNAGTSSKVDVNVASTQNASPDLPTSASGTAPKSITPQQVQDTFTKFEKKSCQGSGACSAPLMLHTGSDVCHYNAKLDPKKWRDYPLVITLSSAKQVNPCPQLKEEDQDNTVDLGHQPTYSDLLHASLTVEDEFTRRPFFLKRKKNDRILIRIHPQERP